MRKQSLRICAAISVSVGIRFSNLFKHFSGLNIQKPIELQMCNLFLLKAFLIELITFEVQIFLIWLGIFEKAIPMKPNFAPQNPAEC
jgi:hypothetical protein